MNRVLTAVLGILIGAGVYSYGMFHTLLPSWDDIVDVANCGIALGAPLHAEPTTAFGSGDSLLCQVAPGQWVRTPYGDGPFFLGLAIAFGSVLLALYRSSILKVATTSALGTITLLAPILGIPMILLGLHLNFVEGTLTPDWAPYVVLYGALGGIAMGIMMWYTVIRRLRPRLNSNNQ